MHRDQIRALLGEHVPGSSPDEAEITRIQSTLSLLTSLPEFEPGAGTWEGIQRRLPAPAAGGIGFRRRGIAAAALAAAVLLFAVVVMPPRTRALPIVVETGKALSSWNDRYTAPHFATLLLPDVGTLKLNAHSTLRFLSPRRVLLESGEVFAEIRPSGEGFEIQSGESHVRVKGTRFGVTAPSTVYVVEGAVEVTSPRGRLSLGPRQVSVDSRLVELGPEDHLRWLAQYERPSVRLKLDPRDQTTITPGSPLRWNLILESDAIAPLTLGKPRDVSQFFSLIVDGIARPLDAARVTVKEARTGANGLVRLDVNHACILEIAVDPGLFHEKGRVNVRAMFASGNPAGDTLWEGIVHSQAITVEIR
jgi:hypothetical protein